MTQLPRYNAYKPSGVDWLGDIPEGWEVENSKWLFFQRKERANKNDIQLTASQKYGMIYQYQFMELEGRKVTQVVFNNEILKHVEENDFVISMRSFQGGIEYCSSVGSVSSAYVPLIPSNKIYAPYFKHLFKSQRYIEALQSTSNLVRDGQALRYENFCMILLPIVPLTEQTAIATFLDQKTAQIDEAIAIKEQQISLLKERKQIIIQQAVTKGLDLSVPMKDSGVEWIGEIPAHWEVKKLKFSSAINRDSLSESTPKNFSLQYVDIGSVTYENGVEKVELFSFKESPSRARRVVSKGDTIVSTVRTYLKAIAFIDENNNTYVYSTGFAVISPNKNFYSKFITNFIKSNAFTYQVDSVAKGMSYPAINSTDLSNLYIVQPYFSEQLAITTFLDQKTAQIDEAISLQQEQINKLKEYKTTLINAVVTGKVKVSDNLCNTVAQIHLKKGDSDVNATH